MKRTIKCPKCSGLIEVESDGEMARGTPVKCPLCEKYFQFGMEGTGVAEKWDQGAVRNDEVETPFVVHLLNINGALCAFAALVLAICAFNAADRYGGTEWWPLAAECGACVAAALLSFAFAQLAMMFARLVHASSVQVSILKEIRDRPQNNPHFKN